jgi:SAM-dependent methyltransferase
VSAGQCWHWFDRPRAAAEAFRVLKPGGKLVIAHFDWLPLPGNVVQATEELIKVYNPSWADLPVLKLSGSAGIYRDWFADVALAGFADIESFSFDVDVPYSHEAWRGRIRASAGVAAAGLAPETITAFDDDLARVLHDRFPAEPLRVPHRVFALVACKPPC